MISLKSSVNMQSAHSPSCFPMLLLRQSTPQKGGCRDHRGSSVLAWGAQCHGLPLRPRAELPVDPRALGRGQSGELAAEPAQGSVRSQEPQEEVVRDPMQARGIDPETETLHREDRAAQRESRSRRGPEGTQQQSRKRRRRDIWTCLEPGAVVCHHRCPKRSDRPSMRLKSGGNSWPSVARLVPDVQGALPASPPTGCPAAPTPHVCDLRGVWTGGPSSILPQHLYLLAADSTALWPLPGGGKGAPNSWRLWCSSSLGRVPSRLLALVRGAGEQQTAPCGLGGGGSLGGHSGLPGEAATELRSIELEMSR